MPPRRKLASVPEKPRKPSPDLRDSIEDALTAMTWLEASDQALADVARKLAEQIETATARADELEHLFRDARDDPGIYRRLQRLEAMCDVTKTVGWLGPQLQGMLRDLGGTPGARKAFRSDQPVGGRLAALRAAAAGKRDAEAVDTPDPGVDA